MVGECIPIQNCSVMMNMVLKANPTQAEIVLLRANQCGYDNKVPLICCPKLEVPLAHADTTTTKIEIGTENGPGIEVPGNETCVTPNGALGDCIALENCNSLLKLHQKESLTQEELQYLVECECESPNSEEVRVCCPKTLEIVEEEVRTTTTEATPEERKCETPNQVAGICLSLIQCKSLMKIMHKTEFFENDMQYLRASFCADADRFPMVCCPDISMTEDTFLSMPPYCGKVLVENNTDDHNQNGNTADDTATTTTDIDEYPWTALLVYTNPRGQLSFPCGGTLIHEHFVLTAAHCLEEEAGISKLTGVRLGEWATQVSKDCQSKNAEHELCAPTQHDVAVEKLITHPEYNSTNNDLALLRLAEVVSFTRYISPICLPFGSSQLAYPLVDTTMYVAGWSAKSASEISSFKMKSSLAVQNLTACMIQYSTRAGVNLTDRHICAAGKSAADSIIVDSGGALMNLVEIGKVQSYFLVGVNTLSYEYSLRRGFAGVYTHIGAYLDWIRNEIKNN
ncbi:PREDICTED: serine protease easter-like [Rhagoletis zephyria]|uniref:serine protease easter-like n=1 Tax=Rhagoletis zephyria TaxID=28612 RepID=UPI0008116E76|nr:PREDICTED: serine protease easter-like [Rhagoletis zephyria]